MLYDGGCDGLYERYQAVTKDYEAVIAHNEDVQVKMSQKQKSAKKIFKKFLHRCCLEYSYGENVNRYERLQRFLDEQNMLEKQREMQAQQLQINVKKMAAVKKVSRAAKSMNRKLDSRTTEGNSKKRLVEGPGEEEKVPEALDKSLQAKG